MHKLILFIGAILVAFNARRRQQSASPARVETPANERPANYDEQKAAYYANTQAMVPATKPYYYSNSL